MEPTVSSLYAEVSCLNFYDFHSFFALVLELGRVIAFRWLYERCMIIRKAIVYQDR